MNGMNGMNTMSMTWEELQEHGQHVGHSIGEPWERWECDGELYDVNVATGEVIEPIASDEERSYGRR